MGGRRTIVIIGAGIGGLTAALALAGAGFRVVIAERSAELREAGAGIQLSPNAGRVLDALGLDRGIAAAATEPEAIAIRDGASGRTITTIPTTAFSRRDGFPYRVIHRANLLSVLAEAVRRHPHVDLRLSTSLDAAFHQAGGYFVKLRGSRRGGVVPAVGLIGADGVWSATRDLIAGAARPKPTGRTAWRVTLPFDSVPPSLRTARVGLWLGRDAHLVHYPVAKSTAVNFVAIVEEDWNRPGWTTPGDRAWLAGRFSAWAEPVRDVVKAPFAWQKWAINDVDPTAAWSNGPVALLGDAAHAMPPFLAQGGAMAIEDAAVLARLLGAATDVPAAISAYEAERKPRVSAVWKAAQKAGARYHFGPVLSLMRDRVLHAVGPSLIRWQYDWIYRWTAE